eukprot:6478293-Amphidinium_carterae.1
MERPAPQGRACRVRSTFVEYPRWGGHILDAAPVGEADFLNTFFDKHVADFRQRLSVLEAYVNLAGPDS